MQFSTLAIISALTSTALSWDKSSSGTGVTTTTPPPPPTSTCFTITRTNAPTCTALPTACTTEDCLQLSTITQSCGCASIYTSDVCVTTCPGLKCGVSYITIYLPCPTSLPSPPYSYSNTTATTTITDISTLTTCPATCTCSGQTTTWSGSQGPFSCTQKKGCTAQLPGGGATTITGTTVVSKTGPTPTSASSTGPTLAASDGKKRNEVVSGGILAGLLGALAFL